MNSLARGRHARVAVLTAAVVACVKAPSAPPRARAPAAEPSAATAPPPGRATVDAGGPVQAAPSSAARRQAPRTLSEMRSVVVISIDGLRREYLDDRDHAIPTLRRLMREGTTARSLRSVWPSMTYPAHTTLVTGVSPARHGILNNQPFDPLGKSDGAWLWFAPEIKVPTLWDEAKKAGLDVMNVTWPVTVGADIRYNLPQIWRQKTEADEKYICGLSSPGLCDELRAHRLAVPLDHRTDAERARAAMMLLAEKKPRLSFVYLTDLDTNQHAFGPFSDVAYTTLEMTDKILGAVFDTARKMGGRVTVVLVSDHGFARTTSEMRPNVVLRRAGLLDATWGGRVKRYDAFAWKAGGSAAIMMRDPKDDATRARVRALFEDLAKQPSSGIARAVDGAVVEREGGFPGAALVLQAADGFVFSERLDEPMTGPSNYRGAHGHDPARADMAASLVLWGDGIKARADLGDVRMIDVAPTIAALLGFRMPSAEGAPLVGVLEPAVVRDLHGQ